MAKLPVILMLENGGYISETRKQKLVASCRDAEISVYRDLTSGVIYIDPEFEGKTLDYYSSKSVLSSAIPRNEMDVIDTERRSTVLRPYIAGRRWLDFGCGPGYQIRHDHLIASQGFGLELNEQNRSSLIADGYNVSAHIEDAYKFKPDVVSLFHVLEHLTDPQKILSQLNSASSDNATLIVEVPHANDWLLSDGPESFKHFTFWSEHIILHTRQSLKYVLQQAGWHVSNVIGVQRYPIWNHFEWCLHNRPSGSNATAHDSSALSLHKAYEHFLSSRDQTDTLIAIAHRKSKQ
jgi:2-polyprenyl-3-methyl-5-hydroxy-6-metoxy-1,4-benzoquinol methylase